MRGAWPGRLAWGIALLCIVMALASVPLLYLNRSAIYSFNTDFSTLFPAITFALLGGLVASRRPANPIGWLMLSLALGTSAAAIGLNVALRAQLSGSSPGGWVRWPALAYNMNSVPLGALVLVILLFPDGRSLGRRWRWVTWLTAVFAIAYLIGTALDPVPSRLAPHLPAVGSPMGVRAFKGFGTSPAFLLYFVLFVVALVSLVLRRRRAAGDEREQLRWFVYAVGLSVGLLVLGFLSFFASLAAGNVILDIAFALGFALAIPAAAAIAILKYGLYEIDVVINKTIVYGLLAAFFTVVYLAVVVGIGTAIGSAHNAFLTLAAAALIAAAFNPVRDRAKSLANRIAYGDRATPYEVLSEFAEKMAATYSLEDVLPRTAQMLAQGTGATRADVWLVAGNELVDEATWPEGATLERVALEGQPIEIPGSSRTAEVRHQGELLGALSIHKAAGDPLTPIEDKLLADVASQAGLVLRNVGLIEDLKASRQRIVSAQDAERRKIERNIHDGAQQQLVALALKAKLADSLVGRDETKAHEMLGQVQTDLRDALENLRDLARGIYPPLLADQGLAAALAAQARKSAVPTTVESDGIGRYPQESEAAVYFCTLEALQNVAKYAQASHAVVRLGALDGYLSFSIEDDGVGFDPKLNGYGTGMQGMSDRLAALGGELRVTSTPGGGTLLQGSVPVDGVA
jgi:signal transduction histidine kinase